MTPTKIKLCGMTRPADIEAANELMPDYIGFVFAPKSKRHVTAAQAKELKALLAPSIKAVGVFVNESPSVIVQLAKGGILDAVQLHGNEDASYIADLRNHLDIPILQAFRIRTAEDAGIAQGSTADSVLLDAGAGTGTVFDWSLIASVTRPYFLAGGLTPENVADA
ncbi:MAG: phosphoribosylanthranilate isomerase, partial [Selenomonadaceae bacterium]|nr:phosphoribosylanthranilate isomerase [Selenomonadaceae bacterium]